MAKKKTKKTQKGSRKKRVSGTSALESTLLMGVSAVVGGVVAPFVVNALDTAAAAKVPKTVTRGAVAALGIAGIYFGRKNPMLEGLAIGVTAVSGAMAANEFGLNIPGISGITAVGNHPSRHSSRRVGGFAKVGMPAESSTNTRAMAIGGLFAN